MPTRPAHHYAARLVLMLAVGAALLTPPRAVAQDTTPLVLRLGTSTRAMALGGAFPVGSRDSDGVFYNPAFFDAVRGFGAHVQRWGSSGTHLAASGGAEWWGGTLAFGVQSLLYGIETVQVAPLTLDERTLFADGPGGMAEHVAALSFARRVGGVRLAGAAKYVAERRGTDSRQLAAFDIATGAELGPVLVGVSVHDLDPALRIPGDGSRLPTRAAVRAATRSYPLGPLDLVLAGAVEHRLDVARTAGGAGAELSWWPIVGRTFSGRIGLRSHEAGGSPLTIGAGFTGDRIALDWAFRDIGDARGTHRFGVRYR